jgi:hypothetical protein
MATTTLPLRDPTEPMFRLSTMAQVALQDKVAPAAGALNPGVRRQVAEGVL